MPDESSEREAPGDASREEPARRGSRRGWSVLAALLLLLSLSRLWKLDADPPGVVVGGYSGQAHFRDEAAKAHEARNKAKWDQWSLSEVDEYGFWRAQSPSWVWGECLWFRGFGVGLLQARSFVVIQTIVALALLMWLAMIRHGLPAAVATGLLLGLNWAYLVYSRLALMEGALICWLLVATVALSQLERRPAEAGRWSMLAVASMLVACTIKQTGLLVVPAFAITLTLLGLRAAGTVAGFDDADTSWLERLRARLRRREARVTLIAVVTLASVLSLLVFNPEYQQRLAFNAAHFTKAYDQSVLGRAAQTLARGFFSARLQRMFMVFAPFTLWLAGLELVRVLVLAWRRRRARKRGEPRPEPRGLLEGAADPIDLWMLAWAIFALLANLASPHRAIRFQLVLLPPAAWLAGALIGRAWSHRWPSARWARAMQAGLVILALLGTTLTTMRFVTWTRSADASAAWIGDELHALIGEREAVVVGEFAAQAVFETDYRHFYVRPKQFNRSAEILHALEITHLVVEGEDDFVEELMKKEVPELLVGRRKLGEVGFRWRTLTVWELASAERRAEIEAWELSEKKRKRVEARAERQRKGKERRARGARRRREEKRALACLPDPLPERIEGETAMTRARPARASKPGAELRPRPPR